MTNMSPDRSNYASLRKKIYGYLNEARYNMFHGKKDAVKRPPNTRRQLNTPWKFNIYSYILEMMTWRR